MSMPSYINSIKPIKPIDLPKLKLIETDSVPKKSQSLREWAMAGGGVPESHKDRADVWHKKAQNYAKGGEVRMQKGGKMGVGIKIADAVADASKQADEILAVKKAAGKLEEAMKAKQAPMTSPQGTGLPLMPRSQGMYIPGVKQEDLPRMPKVDKARAEGKSPAYTERMQDLLDSPTARKKVDKLINKGKDLNVQEWYGTEPLRQVAMDAGLSPDEFNTLIAQLASASQRNPVDQQNKMGSYLHYLSKTGQLPDDAFLLTNKIKRGKQEMPEGTPIELPLGYGSLAQGDIFSRGKQIASGDIMGALPPDKKLGTFYRNYLGNLKPVTVDVNAVRGPIIERGDPRWLASKLVEKDEEGNVIATHFPRRDVAEGRMSLKEAKDRPGFWEAAPSGSEYAGFEDLWQRGAKRHDISPAEAQALGWYGSADVTALKTKPELYIDNLERMIKRTAEQTGQHPLQVMDDVIRGKGFLYKEGGAVEKRFDGGGLAAADFAGPEDDGGSLDKAKLMTKILAEEAKKQGSKEAESLSKPRALTDLMNRGVLANNPLSAIVDMVNMGLIPLDILGSKLTGRDIKVSSDKPFLGSEYVKDLMNKYNVTSGEERPMMETALSFASPTGMIKGAQKTAELAKRAPEALSSVRGGLETLSADAQRPFRSATLTMEGVAPDLGQKGGDKFKDLVTKRMISGEGAPVGMERMGGRKTEKTTGQGLYENFAGQQETNPMVGVTIPRAGNLSTNKRLIADIGTAGRELGQEMVAAHKFTPLMFKNPKDATAMMIGGSERLTKDQIQNIADALPGMIVTHSPKNNSMFVAPFEGDALDYKKASQAASEILGKGAKVQFGKADSNKDIMFRGDYDKMGARPPSAESIEMRNRLKKAEERIVRGPSVSQPLRQSQPATLTNTVR